MPTNDYILRYRLDETSGTTLADATGTYPATISGGVTLGQAGRVGLAASFNGSSGYATGPASNALLSGASGATLCAWVNPTSLTTDRRILSLARDNPQNITSTTSSMALLCGRSSGRFSAFARNSSGALVQLDSTATYATGWRHIAATYGATACTLYVDGQPAGTAAMDWTQTAITSMLPLVVGASPGYTLPFPGLIDDVRIYARALLAAEVAAIYAGDDNNGAMLRRLCCAGGD